MTFGKFNVDYEQRIYNPERLRQYRLDRAQTMLKKHGLGSIVINDFDNFRYLGYCRPSNFQRRRPGNLWLLLIKDAGYPYAPADSYGVQIDLNPWYKDRLKLQTRVPIMSGLSLDDDYTAGRWADQAEEIKGLLKQHSVLDEPCGVTMYSPNMIDACRKVGINIIDGNKAIGEARMIKNADEIECIRTAGSIVESAFWEVATALRPGVTEWQMAGVAAKACYDQGAEELEGPSFVIRSGPRTSHGLASMTPTDRVVRPGELFIMDINGVGFQGYRTCFYRTFCVGDKPTEQQKELYQETYDIQRALETNIKPGITSHDYAKAVLKINPKWTPPIWPAAGRYFLPQGHQLGLGSGDPGPALQANQSVLNLPPFTVQKGMVFATEVQVSDWDGKQWAYNGCKLENVCAVTDTGAEVLYRFPYKDLITVGLPGTY